MKRVDLLALIAALFLLSKTAPAAQELEGSSASFAGAELSTTDQPVAVVPVAEDKDITARLQRIMNSTGWFKAAQVSVREGVVFLDATTATDEHRRWAGELAKNTQSTVAVVNRIEVESDVRSTFGRAQQELVRFYQKIRRVWPVLVLATLILIIFWLLAKLVAFVAGFFFKGRISSPLLLKVVLRVFSIPVFLLGVYFVLQIAGLTRLAVTVLGGTGLVGIVIGFAFRDIAENFLASLLLSARNPFRSGDLIEVDGHTGVVQNLNTRSTVILSLDGNHVQIPNATVYKSTIKNYSSNPARRAQFEIGIGYDSPITKAQAIILKILNDHPAVLEEPESLVLVNTLGAATVNIRIYYWFNSATYAPDKINSALLRLSKNALLDAGVDLPDSDREVVFPKGVPLVQFDAVKVAAEKKVEEKELASVHNEKSSASESEGNLSNQSGALSKQSECNVPEAGENLLRS
jgi:small conductance mechanosensitive channel